MRKIACEKMDLRRPEECSAILAINQNGCLRESKRRNELAALSLGSDPVSLCSLVADERVSLAEPYGVAIPRLSLPLGVAPITGLVTGGDGSFDFDAAMHEERRSFSSWEIRLGGSTEARISELVGDGSRSSSDRDERAESGEGGSSVNGERGSLEGTRVRPPPGGDDGRVTIALGVISLSCPFGDAFGVVRQNCAMMNVIDTPKNARTHIEG